MTARAVRSRSRHILPVVGTLLLGLLAQAQGPQAPAPPAAEPVDEPAMEEPQGIGRSFRPPKGALIAPGKSPDLAVLFTGDVVGYLAPCG